MPPERLERQLDLEDDPAGKPIASGNTSDGIRNGRRSRLQFAFTRWKGRKHFLEKEMEP